MIIFDKIPYQNLFHLFMFYLSVATRKFPEEEKQGVLPRRVLPRGGRLCINNNNKTTISSNNSAGLVCCAPRLLYIFK